MQYTKDTKRHIGCELKFLIPGGECMNKNILRTMIDYPCT